jgi:hypothetical protein
LRICNPVNLGHGNSFARTRQNYRERTRTRDEGAAHLLDVAASRHFNPCVLLLTIFYCSKILSTRVSPLFLRGEMHVPEIVSTFFHHFFYSLSTCL